MDCPGKFKSRKRASPVVVTTALLALAVSAPSLAGDARGVIAVPAPGESSPGSPAWLYVVGIDNYRNVQKLTTAVADARAIRDLLLKKYQFDRARVMERYNEEATRENIMEDFYSLAKKVGKNDSLFIYFAGHGYDDKTLNQMYWVPVDGRPGKISSYISSLDIRGYLSGIPARHIWLVSDSCFSGSLLADRAIPDAIDERYYREKYKLPSRIIMTSGGKEPVADQSGARDCNGHSVFACYFLKYLDNSEQRYLTPHEIFAVVGPNVSNNSDQTPVIGALLKAGHENGEFVLIQRPQAPQAQTTPQQTVKQPEPAPPASPPPAVPAAAPRPAPATTPEPVSAMARPLGQCQASPTGKGGPMCQVQAGKFGMGCNKAVDKDCDEDEKPLHEAMVKKFRIDRFEVTAGDYRDCVNAGACTVPDPGERCTYGIDGRENHPVNCVDWGQANAYCEWAAKRLPTEAEWEKAARGTDGKKFPWGNSDPECDQAVTSSNGCTSRGTRPVGDSPGGVGPSGAEDMCGNVAEWISECHGKPGSYDPLNPATCNERILRGGSWRSRTAASLRTSAKAIMPSNFRGDISGFRCAYPQ